jgi:osmoprotectant transport system substrate-binding protein
MNHVRFRCPLAVTMALVSAVVLAACGRGSFAPSTKRAVLPSGQPGRGRPPVTLGDKNFTEQYILGQLYAQALRAKGYTVHLKSDIGPSGVTDGALIRGQIDLYPEYTGVIARPSRPTSRRRPSRTAEGSRCSTRRHSRTPTASPPPPPSLEPTA